MIFVTEKSIKNLSVLSHCMFQPPTEYPSHYITSRSCRNKNFLAIHADTIIHQSCSWRNFARLWTSRPVRGSLNRFHVFCIWDRKCVRGAHGTWGNALLYWWRARVCRVAMKCSRTGCRRRVHRGPGRAVSFVGPVFTGHAGCGFFKDLPCYGSETGVRT